MVHNNNNRTAPNKDGTYGKFGWKKIIAHVETVSKEMFKMINRTVQSKCTGAKTGP